MVHELELGHGVFVCGVHVSKRHQGSNLKPASEDTSL
jgi:hypothetical protein